jgi:hypothetical protein
MIITDKQILENAEMFEYVKERASERDTILFQNKSLLSA